MQTLKLSACGGSRENISTGRCPAAAPQPTHNPRSCGRPRRSGPGVRPSGQRRPLPDLSEGQRRPRPALPLGLIPRTHTAGHQLQTQQFPRDSWALETHRGRGRETRALTSEGRGLAAPPAVGSQPGSVNPVAGEDSLGTLLSSPFSRASSALSGPGPRSGESEETHLSSS